MVMTMAKKMIMILLENVECWCWNIHTWECVPCWSRLAWLQLRPLPQQSGCFLHYLFVFLFFFCLNNIFLFAASTFYFVLFPFLIISRSSLVCFDVLPICWTTRSLERFFLKSHISALHDPNSYTYMHIAPAWLREWIRSARKCTGWSQLEQPAFDFSLLSLIFTFLMVQK